MRTTITTCIDANLKKKVQPLLKENEISFGQLLDSAMKKYLEENSQQLNDSKRKEQ